jgi:hypothetical protein
VIKLAEPRSKLGLLWKELDDAGARQSVEHAEFTLAQTLIDNHRRCAFQHCTRCHDELTGLPCASVWRRQHDLRSLGEWALCNPIAERTGLLNACAAERDICVTVRDVDPRLTGSVSSISRNIACAFTVTNQQQPARPPGTRMTRRTP